MVEQSAIQIKDNVLIVDLKWEEISLQEIENLKTELRSYIDRGYSNILINLEKMNSISSVILAAMVYVMQKARLRGGDVKLFNLKESVRKVFKIMLLDKLFEIYNTQQEALNGFNKQKEVI